VQDSFFNKSFYLFYLFLLAIIYSSIPTSVKADTPIISNLETNIKTESPENTGEFITFPVGLSVGKRNVIPSILIRGKENGLQAIDFDNWLLPYDTVIQVLKLKVTNLPDGQLEMRSPGVVTRIDPKKLATDTELGLVFSIQDLQNLFGVKSKFDINEYAIVLEIPWFNKSTSQIGQAETPVILEGLPQLNPGIFNIAAVEQQVNASGTASTSPNYRGNFMAVGTAFNGSWFIRTNQQNLEDSKTWRIAEAQYWRQSKQADYFLGSQPTFWQSQAGGNYWGFTLIQRQGFSPPKTVGGGFANPRQRLQAAQIGRTVTGRAEPGTLVRLTPGFGDRIIAEVLVDSSGIYRFENIKNNQQLLSSNYRILLYPEGRLTAQPEVREANFSTVPGQIPAGASAWVVSGGWRREFSGSSSLLGNFADFRGGISGRWGLSSNLTVGVGGVYDQSFQGLAEVFYAPTNFPLQVAVSALGGDELDVIADVRYDPSPEFNVAFTRDLLTSRFNLNWNMFRGLSLFANASSSDATSGGLQISLSSKNAFTFARASLDTKNRFRWNLLQRLGPVELTQRGNEIGTSSELTYKFSPQKSFNSGNSLLLNYATRSQNRSDNLLTLSWRYRSPTRSNDGNYLWETQLGYGIGSRGNGIIASLGTTIFPGMMLRGRYQGVSLTSEQATFSIDLVSSLNLQRGIRPGDRRSNYFRTQGGLLIQPFFDRNHNGKRDAGEKVYTSNPELLISINNKSIKSLQPDIQSDRISVRLSPGTYRLDLDPSGFPTDWKAETEALAVNIVPGSYTPVQIPLIKSYTRSGIVKDTQGKAVAGARVEAIHQNGVKRRFSVTNGAGVYYLEGLSQGEYQLLVNGKSAGNLTLEPNSEAFQELNIKKP